MGKGSAGKAEIESINTVARQEDIKNVYSITCGKVNLREKKVCVCVCARLMNRERRGPPQVAEKRVGG